MIRIKDRLTDEVILRLAVETLAGAQLAGMDLWRADLREAILLAGNLERAWLPEAE